MGSPTSKVHEIVMCLKVSLDVMFWLWYDIKISCKLMVTYQVFPGYDCCIMCSVPCICMVLILLMERY